MTQEDKELLLRDLCARLPYGLCVQDEYGEIDYVNYNDVHFANYFDSILNGKVKPYLRLMSSMTEEEWEELNCIGHIVPLYDGSFGVDMRAYCKNSQPHYRRFSEFSTIEDWLNAHHFDYRGLIEKGLANEASEEMYSLNK